MVAVVGVAIGAGVGVGVAVALGAGVGDASVVVGVGNVGVGVMVDVGADVQAISNAIAAADANASRARAVGGLSGRLSIVLPFWLRFAGAGMLIRLASRSPMRGYCSGLGGVRQWRGARDGGLDCGGQGYVLGEVAEGAGDGGGAFHVHVVAGVG